MKLFTKNCHFKFLAGLSFKSVSMQFFITYVEKPTLLPCALPTSSFYLFLQCSPKLLLLTKKNAQFILKIKDAYENRRLSRICRETHQDFINNAAEVLS